MNGKRAVMVDSTSIKLVDGGLVECGAVLRSLPGKREVYDAVFSGRPAIVKVFLDRRRARVHFQRELDGLRAFHNAGIAAPEVLYAGEDEQSRPVIVVARIGEAETLSDVWRVAAEAERQRLMGRMMELLARHHLAGIYQTDLHLNNFLVAEGLIYSLDGDGVLAQEGALDERRSLQNLALYCSQLDPDRDAFSLEASARYAQLRSWPKALIRERLLPLIDAARMYRWRKFRSKIYRDCTAVERSRAAGQACYAVRSYGDGLQRLLGDLDAGCPADPAQRLKDGNTATVWRASLDGLDLVVKRYNIKDRWHGVSRVFRESRASVSWRNAHMLEMFGVATPAPVAYCLRRENPLRPVGYFVAEEVLGSNLRDWVAQHRDQADEIRRVATMVASLLARLRRLRISHGDLKATNFILSDNRLFVVDLDAMRLHRLGMAFEYSWRKDMARFEANWRDMPEVLQIMQEAIGTIAQG
jgi:tRNA A-37 threonylcarbamoyl transferase component Bud32